MEKRAKQARKRRKKVEETELLDNFRKLLENVGFKTKHFEGLPAQWHYAENDNFFFRCHSEMIEVGIRKCFDRWANSVDFWTNKIPHNNTEMVEFLLAIERLVDLELFSTAWGQRIDIEAHRRATKRDIEWTKRMVDYLEKNYGDLMRRLAD